MNKLNIGLQPTAPSVNNAVRETLRMGMVELERKIRHGEINPAQFRVKSRMSFKILKDWLGIKALISSNSLLSDPELYPVYRALKFCCEGILLKPAEVALKYHHTITSLKNLLKNEPSIRSKSALANSPRGVKLYKSITSTAYSSTIFRLGGIDQGRPDFFHMDDAEIISRAGAYDSFTKLKYEDGTLHKHIKGRRLESAVACAHPWYARHFFVGQGGILYRSEPELIAGNYLYLNKIDCKPEQDTHVRSGKSSKTMVVDFYLPPSNLNLEIAQNMTGDRGSRGAQYQLRNLIKEEVYIQNGLRFLFFDSDPFYKRGVFDILKFANNLHNKLMEEGVDIGEVPKIEDLIYRDDSIKMRALQEPTETILQYLRSLSIDGIATLQNNFSYILTCLQYRPDYHDVHTQLKKESAVRKSNKQIARHKIRRKGFASILKVKDLCQKVGIHSQKEWFTYTKQNKHELKRLNIPANIQSVYKRKGGWNGWADIWPK